jgi:hypothetical protein
VEALGEIAAAFDAAGAPVCCLKGPPLAERLLDDPALRPSGDLDFAVRREDFDRSLEVLRGLGYGPARECETEDCHRRLSRPGGPPVELHFRLMANFGASVPCEPFLERSISFESRSGYQTRILAPEDEFLFLAAHGAKHLFERLLWAWELKVFLQRHNLDWLAIQQRAQESGLATACWFATAFVHRRLDGPAPPSPRGWLTLGQRLRARLALALLGWEAIPKTIAGSVLRRLFFQGLLADVVPAGARHVARHLARSARRRWRPKIAPSAAASKGSSLP